MGPDATATALLPYTFRASLGGDYFSFDVSRSVFKEPTATLTLKTTSSLNLSYAPFLIDWSLIGSSTPYVSSVSSTWSPSGGDEVDLLVDNVGIAGLLSVVIRPASVTSNSTSAPAINCFLTPSSSVTVYDFDGIPTSTTASNLLSVILNASSSTYWNGTQWLSSLRPLPCRILLWSGSTFPHARNRIILSSPAWIGAAQLQVRSGISVSNWVSITYAPPVIYSVLPTNGGSSGATPITITGNNFGVAASLAEMWASTGAGELSPSLSAEVDYGASIVFFQYATKSNALSDEPFYRRCTVLAWNNTQITCSTPEGISGSRNYITVLTNASVDGANFAWLPSRPGKSFAASSSLRFFTYDAPMLSENPRRVEGTSYLAFRGTEMSRIFMRTTTSLVDSSILNLTTADRSKDLLREDASAQMWTAVGNIRSALDDSSKGLVKGQQFASDIPVAYLSHSNVIFVVPDDDTEGFVEFRLQLLSSKGDTIYSNWVSFSADPPVIHSLAAVPRDSGDDANPCAVIGRPQPTLNSSISQACAALVQEVVNVSVALDAKQPCVRATADAVGRLTQVAITGRRFGSGKWGGAGMWFLSANANLSTALSNSSSITLSSLTGLVARGVAVPCFGSGGASVWQTNNLLQCDIAPSSQLAGLPRGPLIAFIATAFTIVNTTAFNITPQGACACGSYAPADGALCVPCPKGASCPGGGDTPHANAGWWKTLPDEWDERGIDTFLVSVLPFVRCPTPELCRPDNNCKEGSRGFMCSSCIDSFVHNSRGVCVKCSPEKSLFLIIGICIFLVCALAVGFAVRARYGAHFDAALTSYRDSLVREALARSPLSEASFRRTFDAPRFIPLVKIILTFAQSFGALYSYVSGSRVRKVIVGDARLVPWLLEQLAVFTNFGLDTSEFKCAFSVATSNRIIFFLVAPPFVALVIVVIVYPARFAYDATRACVARTRQRDPPPPSKDSTQYAIVAGLFFVLPIIITGLARAQDCAGVADGAYLIGDPAISCAWPRYKTLKSSAFYVGYIYLALPVIAGYLLYRDTETARQALFFMTEGYRTSSPLARIWECLTMVRKVLLCGLASGFALFTDSRTQIVASMGLIAFSLALHLSTKPFIHPALNDLDAVNLLATMSIAFAVVTRVQVSLSAGTAPSAEEQTLIDVFALLTCVPFAVCWVANLIDACFAGVPFLLLQRALACKKLRALSRLSVSQQFLRPPGWQSSRSLLTMTAEATPVTRGDFNTVYENPLRSQAPRVERTAPSATDVDPLLQGNPLHVNARSRQLSLAIATPPRVNVDAPRAESLGALNLEGNLNDFSRLNPLRSTNASFATSAPDFATPASNSADASTRDNPLCRGPTREYAGVTRTSADDHLSEDSRPRVDSAPCSLVNRQDDDFSRSNPLHEKGRELPSTARASAMTSNSARPPVGSNAYDFSYSNPLLAQK